MIELVIVCGGSLLAMAVIVALLIELVAKDTPEQV